MDQNTPNFSDWDDSVYGTGHTEPPKSRGGLIALLLIMMIFLCGIITVLGILNIRLFRELKIQKEADLAISFTIGETQPEETEPMLIQEFALEESDTPYLNLEQSPMSIENIPMEGALSLQDIYARSIPSVVSISCVRPDKGYSGTGVVLTQDGYVVTNAHVVENAMSIAVQLTDDRVFEATLVGIDEVSDLAVLHIDTQDLIPAQFGDSAVMRVGDTVVAIGDPLGVEFRGTYTNGIISGINREVDVGERTMTLIQTNAALNSGNSGGPLINCFGQVIGINTMKIGAFTDDAGVEGLGFAIPSTTVKTIVEELITLGYVSGRPTLGIHGEPLSPFYQSYKRLPAGLLITHVERGSDAYKKGMEYGDILLSINDIRITNMGELEGAIFELEIGTKVNVIFYRSGQQFQVELTLTEDKG